jgi:hypothetical protein
VAEAGVKPESTINVAEIVEPVKKVATLLPVSDEMLEDAPSIQSYLNSRLSLFVRIEEERQLLRGAGTNELIGIQARSGAQAINLYTKLGTDDNAVAIARVIATTAGSANLAPDAIIMHPNNWLTTRLLRDGSGGTAGNFYGSGPFGPSGNNAGAAGLFGQNLWGLPVVLSTVVGNGTALVGNFGQGAHIWRRGGVSVEASNSHGNYFAQNLTAIRGRISPRLGVVSPSCDYRGARPDIKGLRVLQPRKGFGDPGSTEDGGGRRLVTAPPLVAQPMNKERKEKERDRAERKRARLERKRARRKARQEKERERRLEQW